MSASVRFICYNNIVGKYLKVHQKHTRKRASFLEFAFAYIMLYLERGFAMPRKPKKPCKFPGCPRLTDGAYCSEHTRKMNAQYEKYNRCPETAKRYGTAWRIIRRRYIGQHPLCEECLKRGLAVPAEHVHHIVPLADGGTNDESNLMSLCKSCHSRIHLELRRG